MRIVVDKDLCTGQAVCESMVPGMFRVTDEGQAEILLPLVPEDRTAQARLAVSCCPNGALELMP
jgi:ferredoxin